MSRITFGSYSNGALAALPQLCLVQRIERAKQHLRDPKRSISMQDWT